MSKKKQMMDISKTVDMTTALSDEHQRNWDNEKLIRKAESVEGNYDPSRVRLNFQVSRGGKIEPVDKSRNIVDKIEERVKNGVTVKSSIRSTSHRYVSILFGGNREKMLEIAFGEQQINERGNNWDLELNPKIEEWAKDVYNFSCREFGEENIVSFIVHCDEINPHVHCVVVPILPDGRLCCKEMFGGKTLPEARARMDYLHTTLGVVSEKYGLERGDKISETGAKHVSLDEHHRQLSVDNKKLEDEIKEKKEISQSLDNLIAQKEKAIKSLNTMCNNLTAKIESCKEQISCLEVKKQAGQISLKDYQTKKLELEKQIDSFETKILQKQNSITTKQKELDELQREVGGLDLVSKGFNMLKFTHKIPQITELPPKIIGREEWTNNMNKKIKAEFESEMKKVENAYYKNANERINSIRSSSLTNYNELQSSQSVIADLKEKISGLSDFKDMAINEMSCFLTMMALPKIREEVLAVAEALVGGQPVPSVGGGGGSSSDLPWNGRKDDEDEEAYRRRCMLAAFHFVKPKYYQKPGRGRLR